jgi:hypothetical protein
MMKTKRQKAARWIIGLLLATICAISISHRVHDMYTIRERLQIGLKWMLSYQKSEWTLADYPVRVRANGSSPETNIAYCAKILNWPGPAGLGPSEAEAYADLAKNLKAIRKNRESMPRPGTHVPIQFAATDRVEKTPGLLDDFNERVLLFTKNDPVFISDDSSLSDFGDDAKVKELVQRIKIVYSVDVSDIANEPGNIATIIERIEKAGEPPARP